MSPISILPLLAHNNKHVCNEAQIAFYFSSLGHILDRLTQLLGSNSQCGAVVNKLIERQLFSSPLSHSVSILLSLALLFLCALHKIFIMYPPYQPLRPRQNKNEGIEIWGVCAIASDITPAPLIIFNPLKAADSLLSWEESWL